MPLDIAAAPEMEAPPQDAGGDPKDELRELLQRLAGIVEEVQGVLDAGEGEGEGELPPEPGAEAMPPEAAGPPMPEAPGAPAGGPPGDLKAKLQALAGKRKPQPASL